MDLRRYFGDAGRGGYLNGFSQAVRGDDGGAKGFLLVGRSGCGGLNGFSQAGRGGGFPKIIQPTCFARLP